MANREIKFRAWDEYQKKMFYDFEFGNGFDDFNISLLGDGTLMIGAFDSNEDYYELTPLQSTGLKDKNGKDADKVYVYILPNELNIYNEENLSKRINKKVKVFVVNDKNKYDPENKSGKVKPGRPGIYIE